MGYLYVMGIMSAGVLGVLLLALSTEQARQRVLRQALNNFPGFTSDGLLFEGGMGLAIDRPRRMLCTIAATGGDIRLTLVPFGDILGCALLRDGRRVVHCQTDPGVGADRDSSNASGLELYVYTRAPQTARHRVVVPTMPEALRWFYAIKVLVGATADADQAPEPAAPVSSAAAEAVDLHDEVVEPEAVVSLARVRERVGAAIADSLTDKTRFTIGERQLRDTAGLAMPLVEFHQHMNQLRRTKAFAFATLSYSRKDESWTIARRR